MVFMLKQGPNAICTSPSLCRCTTLYLYWDSHMGPFQYKYALYQCRISPNIVNMVFWLSLYDGKIPIPGKWSLCWNRDPMLFVSVHKWSLSKTYPDNNNAFKGNPPYLTWKGAFKEIWLLITVKKQTLFITGSDNGLWPGWCQAIIWFKYGKLGFLEINFNEIFIKINIFSFNEMYSKLLSGNWQPFASASKC